MPPQEVPAPPPPRREEAGHPELAAELSSLSRAVKWLEESLTNLRRKVQIDEANTIAAQKRIFDELRLFGEESDEIRRELADIKTKIIMIVKELKTTAKAEDVKVLQRYLELWEPVQFATRAELERALGKG